VVGRGRFRTFPSLSGGSWRSGLHARAPLCRAASSRA
jgi:hypothetical protein